MSDIIFIGPYRQYDHNGTMASLHIKTIRSWINDNNQHRLIIRNIITDIHSINRSRDICEAQCETIPVDVNKKCTIIQNVPINDFAAYPGYNNICIPIIDPLVYKYDSHSLVDRLNYANYILVANENAKNMILRSNIKSKCLIYDIDYIKLINQEYLNKQYNLGDISGNTKYYGFMGSYAHNKDMINKIIEAFLLFTKSCLLSSNDNLFRCVFFLKGTQKDKQALEHMHTELRKKIGMPFIDNNIIRFVFGYLDLESSISALNSIDYFLDLNQDTNNDLYIKYMSQYRRGAVINFHGGVHSNIISNKSEYENTDVLHHISISDILSKLLNSISKGLLNKKTKNANTMKDILCQIVI